MNEGRSDRKMRYHSKQIESIADHTTFTIDDNNLRSGKRKQILKSKSVLKKRKNHFVDGGKWPSIFVLCFAVLPCMIECQYSTRDPRWYSREGDYNYQWPNPGDPEYR